MAKAPLSKAQEELEQYDPEAELRKALNLDTDLAKGRGAAPSGDAGDDDDQDGESDEGDEPEGDADDESGDTDDDGGDEGSAGDDADEDDEDDAPPPPPAKKKMPPQAMKRSMAGTDAAAEDLLKSMLLTPAGEPTPAAEIIEVSDVLTMFADTLAKSHGDTMAEVGTLQLQIEELAGLVKAMARNSLAQSQRLRKVEQTMAKSLRGAAVTQPDPGQSLAFKKRMPAGDGAQPEQPAGALNKSIVAAGLQVAYQTSQIDADQFRGAMGALDSQGPEAALARVPGTLAKSIREYKSE